MFSKRQTKSITKEPKNGGLCKQESGATKIPAEGSRKDRNLVPQPLVKDVEPFMARENAQRLEKSVQKCKNSNHFASQCLSKNVHLVESDQQPRVEPDTEEFEELFIGQVQKDGHDNEMDRLLYNVNDNKVQFKLDTEAQANVIPKHVFNSLKGTLQLRPTKAKLTGFNGSEIPVVGVARMTCKYKDKMIDSDFFVVEAEGSTTPTWFKSMSGT